MHYFPIHYSIAVLRFLIVMSMLMVACILPCSAADVDIEAELGDTITLHGVSYVGDRVYLFMTGPGLPSNGVTLTDTSQRADQGEFTMVDLADDQTWTMRWNTARIQNEIDEGTYIVYVTNEPVDKAHLGGESSYKTLEVFFKESTTKHVSVSGIQSYTLKPEEHSSTEVPTIVLTAPTPEPTTVEPTPSTSLPTPTIPVPTAKSPGSSFTTCAALLISAGFIIIIRYD